MSKINLKNLSYDTSLPPFLARLQAENASNDGRQDYHAARPKKPRDAELDKEDEPVYFDEQSGETLTRGEWEEREKFEGTTETAKDEPGAEGAGTGVDEMAAVSKEKSGMEKEKLAAIGGGRKRKAGKVVGGEEDVDNDASRLKEAHMETKKPTPNTAFKDADKPKKTAKKGKKVKLSFGDDE